MNIMNKKIEIPIFYYWKDGKKVYDYNAMAEEFEEKIGKITNVSTRCSITEDKNK